MEFVTIEQEIQAEIIEKKSKFIASVFPIETVEEAENIIKQVKKKYYDARHNCVAYRIERNNQIIEKSNDDGEPSGTAGAPMLNILKKNNLVNVLVVNTRYFGGILLGTGGLVRAYSDSLQKAIEQSKKILKCQGIEMLALVDYSEFDKFKYYCNINEINISNIQYSQSIECIIELVESKEERLKNDFNTKSIILKDLKEIRKKYVTKNM